jgi:hypothetical protein
MSHPELVERVISILDKTNTTYSDAAVFAGVAPTTMRRLIEMRRAPERMKARRQLERFVEANSEAASRADLRAV